MTYMLWDANLEEKVTASENIAKKSDFGGTRSPIAHTNRKMKG